MNQPNQDSQQSAMHRKYFGCRRWLGSLHDRALNRFSCGCVQSVFTVGPGQAAKLCSAFREPRQTDLLAEKPAGIREQSQMVWKGQQGETIYAAVAAGV